MLAFNQHFSRLILLKFGEDVVLNYFEPLDPYKCLATVDALFGIELSLKLLQKHSHELCLKRLLSYAEVYEVCQLAYIRAEVRRLVHRGDEHFERRVHLQRGLINHNCD